MEYEAGEIYTLDEITSHFGGNEQAAMPIVGGQVPYCKFNPEFNPKFPEEIWVEEGPDRKEGARIITESDQAIPTFEKVEPNQWKYLGKKRFTDITDQDYVDDINKSPPNDPVAIILEMS